MYLTRAQRCHDLKFQREINQFAGPDFRATFQRAADLVDKILWGAAGRSSSQTAEEVRTRYYNAATALTSPYQGEVRGRVKVIR